MFQMISDNLNNSKLSRVMIQNKFCFVLAVIFQLAPVLHYYENLRYALKTRRCEKSQDRVGARQNYLKMLKEDQDVALLRIFECFLEAAPQQILQLTLLLKHHDMKIYCKYFTLCSLVKTNWLKFTLKWLSPKKYWKVVAQLHWNVVSCFFYKTCLHILPAKNL